MIRHIKNILGILAITAVIISCKSKASEEASAHEELAPDAIELSATQYAASDLVMGNVEMHNLRQALEVNGNLTALPGNIASVSAPMGGFIKSTNLYQGSRVQKGQQIATIENMAFIDLQQEYLEVKARYNFADIEFKRHSDLYRENVYSEKNVQQTETEYKTLKARLSSLGQKLRMIGIDPDKLKEDHITGVLPVTAPISGFLKSVNVNIGKYVGPTDVMFEIVNSDALMLELVIFEKDINKVSAGQHVVFSIPDNPSKKYSAEVTQAGKTLDNDKTAFVYASVENPEKNLVSGMYVSASISGNDAMVTALPDDAVVQFDEKFYIFIPQGKRNENGKDVYDFKAVEVKKGSSSDGFTEIILPAGFNMKNPVVVKGAYTLLSAWKNAGEMAC